ncbi:MAG: integrin alpha, partial [Myxococcota bacterium]
MCSSSLECGDLEACIGGACQSYASTCAADAPCAAGWFCDDGGACRKILEDGQACQDGAHCQSGFCADGVCCESACDGLCLACMSTLTAYPSGTCVPVVAGTDPHGECAGDLACDGVGACYDTPIGATCAGREECPSGHCVDGVCCERACDGTCEACASELTGAADGVCMAVADGSDPQSECEGELTCSGFRNCHTSYGDACAIDAQCEGNACLDSLCGLAAPRLLAPPNGEATGTVHVAGALTPRLRWREAAGWYPGLTYDLQVDDSCDATAFQSCTFPSPEVHEVVLTTEHTPATPLAVSYVQPVGRRYFWRLRTCASASECSTWSEVRYLDVGRQPKDFNGDGYADMVVGMPTYDGVSATDTGAAYMYFGAERTTLLAKSTPDQTLVNPDNEPGA